MCDLMCNKFIIKKCTAALEVEARRGALMLSELKQKCRRTAPLIHPAYAHITLHYTAIMQPAINNICTFIMASTVVIAVSGANHSQQQPTRIYSKNFPLNMTTKLPTLPRLWVLVLHLPHIMKLSSPGINPCWLGWFDLTWRVKHWPWFKGSLVYLQFGYYESLQPHQLFADHIKDAALSIRL